METRNSPSASGPLVSFYCDEDKRIALYREAMSWRNTPVVPHGAAKGVGVDCVSLLGEIYRATGVLADYAKPHYEMSGGQQLEESILERYIRETNRFEMVWRRPALMTKRFMDLSDTAKPGDCLCFTMGRVTHHVALGLGGKMVLHAIAGPGVVLGTLNDSTLAKRIQTIYRPLPL